MIVHVYSAGPRVNGLAQTYCTIRSPTQQLLFTVREHQMQVSPITDDIQPLPQRKKKMNAPVLCPAFI